MNRSQSALLILGLAAAATHADESLPRDPANAYGTFDNGVKYIIRHNANPPGRVNLDLHVKTGALNESDRQNGLAHFLEHMAFNGSANFPPGKLIPLLAHLGMTFGADTNAHTNLWETVYKLHLPDTKPKTVELASRIFADYADGLNLSDEEINSERKIILEEYRTRQGAANRIGKRQRKDLYPGTRLATHDVIGDAEQIETFPPDQFRAYYDEWYRPENMTLIVVGDVTPDQVIAAMQPTLGAFKARTPVTAAQTAGLKPTTRPQAFVYTDPEQTTADIEASTLAAGRPAVTTADQYRREMMADVATAMVNRRLRNLIASGKAPFREADTDVSRFLSEAIFSQGEATGEPADWKAMLTTLVSEIDRAVEHGFSEGEVKLTEGGLIAKAEQAVRAEATRDSTSVVNALASDVGQERPLLSARQELDLLKSAFAAAKPADFTAAFKEAFKTQNFNYSLSMPEKPGVTPPTPAEVLTAAEAAWAVKTEPPTDVALSGSLLEKEPAPGVVGSSATDADLGIRDVTFANGVVMHHKFSDYKKDSVLVTITLPGGQIEETAENRGLSELAGVIVDRPATGRFTSTDLADLLTASTIKLDGGLAPRTPAIGRDTLTLRLSSSRADLPKALQLAYALLTDGKLEQSAVDDWKKTTLQEIAQDARKPQGQLQKALGRTIYGGDPRFMPLTAENVNKLTREQAQAWFDRIAKSAAVEIAVVGDVSADDAEKLVASYAGSLPKREQDFKALDGLRVVKRGDGPFEAAVAFDSQTPQALAIGGFIGCDETSPDRRPLTVAAEVLTNRMIARIREKEQLVYSIGASNRPARGLPGTGAFSAGSMTDPKNGDALADTVNSMLADFAKDGPTDDELATAKKQVMTEITTTMREPGWWLTQIAEMRYRGRPIADLKNLPGVFDTFSKEDVKNVVAKYLKPETTLRFVMTPKSWPATRPTH